MARKSLLKNGFKFPIRNDDYPKGIWESLRVFYDRVSWPVSSRVAGLTYCAGRCTLQEGEGLMGLSLRVSMRRSTRIQVRIPVSVTGTLPSGESFTEQTYVLTVSKFGARLKCSHPLSPGMEIRVKPKAGNADETFHVVWARGGADGAGEVGIQCVKATNLFGIAFPD